MQRWAASSSRPFKPTLAGASPATDTIVAQCQVCPRSSIRQSALCEGRGCRCNPTWTPFQCPCAFSSNRASFVNSYTSVRVRPGAPVYGDHGVRVSIPPCEGGSAGANPVGHPNFDGPKLIGYPPNQEGVASWAKAQALRVRFPAWECLRSITSLVHRNSLRAVEVGLSLIRTWSPVRIRPSAPDAEVAQGIEHVNSQFTLYPSCFRRAVDCGLSWTQRQRFNSALSHSGQ